MDNSDPTPPIPVDEFKHNILLLLHNMYKEGIAIDDICLIYERFFHRSIVPSMFHPSAADWVTAITKAPELIPYLKIVKSKTRLVSHVPRSEIEMKGLARIAQYRNLSPNAEQLIDFVRKHYSRLQPEERDNFRSNLINSLNEIDESLPANSAPLSCMNGSFPEQSPNISRNLTQPSSSSNQNAHSSISDNVGSTLLKELLGIGIDLEPINGMIYHPDHFENGGKNRRKRISVDGHCPSAKKPKQVDATSAIVEEDVGYRISEGGSTTHQRAQDETTNSLPQNTPLNDNYLVNANETPPFHVRMEIVSVGELIVKVEPEENASQPNEEDEYILGEPKEQDQENTLLQREHGEYIVNQNGQNEDILQENDDQDIDSCSVGTTEIEQEQTDNHQDSSSPSLISNDIMQRSVCELTSAIVKQFKDKVENRRFEEMLQETETTPEDWMVCRVSQDDLGFYRGREKNCVAKRLDMQSKSWKLYVNEHRILKLPNKMVVYGEFVVSDNATIFEIVDMVELGENGSLIERPCDFRYAKCIEWKSHSSTGTNGNIRTAVKTLVEFKDLYRLISPLDDRHFLFVHKGNFGSKPLYIFKGNQEADLMAILKEAYKSNQRKSIPNATSNNTETVGGRSTSADSIAQISSPNHTTTVDSLLHITNGHETVSAAEGVSNTPAEDSVSPDVNNCNRLADSFLGVEVPTESRQKRIFTPAKKKSHSCGPSCLELIDINLTSVSSRSPFFLCTLYGWERKITPNTVVYTTPCGKTIEEYKEIMSYLLQTGFSAITTPFLTIDYFSFDTAVRHGVEFPVWQRHLLEKDISHGKEAIPISCFNGIPTDATELPQFEYIMDYITGDFATPPLFDVGNECVCTDECQPNYCGCVAVTSNTARAPAARYFWRCLSECVPGGIYECNPECKCDSISCGNRVTQGPLKWKLEVFKKADGWGLRTLHDIPASQFICLFIGKIVLQKDALSGLSRYQIKLKLCCPFKRCSKQSTDNSHGGKMRKEKKGTDNVSSRRTRNQHLCAKKFAEEILYIDATEKGNVGRFIDHSNEPNAFIQTIYLETAQTTPRISFFAKTMIEAGTEIIADFTNMRDDIPQNSNSRAIKVSNARPGPSQSKPKSRHKPAEHTQNSATTGQGCSRNCEATNSATVNNNTEMCKNTGANTPVSNSPDIIEDGIFPTTHKLSLSMGSPILCLERIKIEEVVKKTKLINSPLSKVKTESVDESGMGILSVEILAIKQESGDASITSDNPLPESSGDTRSPVSGASQNQTQDYELIEINSTPEDSDGGGKSVSESVPQPPTTPMVEGESYKTSALQHDCLKNCLVYNDSGLPHWVLKNKLFCCQAFGFKRLIDEFDEVVYVTSCGIRFANEKDLFNFLTKLKFDGLTIENFCFDATVNCNYECAVINLGDNHAVVDEDISRGEEILDIKCVNKYGHIEPEGFRYITRSEISEKCLQSLDLLQKERIFNAGCQCEDGCIDPDKCTCIQRQFLGSMTTRSSNSKHLQYTYRKIACSEDADATKQIIECNPMCRCSMTCANRVVQNPTTWLLQVFQTGIKGWGLRTLQDIPKGAYICNYVGVYKREEEVETGDPHYQAATASRFLRTCASVEDPVTFIVDATKEGNISRFINHSCSPNLFVQNVVIPDEPISSHELPTIAFFANRNIESSTELTFNYCDVIQQKDFLDSCLCETHVQMQKSEEYILSQSQNW